MVGSAGTRVRWVGPWAAQVKELLTFRVVQGQSLCPPGLTLLLALDGCYMKKQSVVNKDGCTGLRTLSYRMILPILNKECASSTSK